MGQVGTNENPLGRTAPSLQDTGPGGEAWALGLGAAHTHSRPKPAAEEGPWDRSGCGPGTCRRGTLRQPPGAGTVASLCLHGLV